MVAEIGQEQQLREAEPQHGFEPPGFLRQPALEQLRRSSVRSARDSAAPWSPAGWPAPGRADRRSRRPKAAQSSRRRSTSLQPVGRLEPRAPGPAACFCFGQAQPQGPRDVGVVAIAELRHAPAAARRSGAREAGRGAGALRSAHLGRDLLQRRDAVLDRRVRGEEIVHALPAAAG